MGIWTFLKKHFPQHLCPIHESHKGHQALWLFHLKCTQGSFHQGHSFILVNCMFNQVILWVNFQMSYKHSWFQSKVAPHFLFCQIHVSWKLGQGFWHVDFLDKNQIFLLCCPCSLYTYAQQCFSFSSILAWTCSFLAVLIIVFLMWMKLHLCFALFVTVGIEPCGLHIPQLLK